MQADHSGVGCAVRMHVCDSSDGWMVAWACCECVLVHASTLWPHGFTPLSLQADHISAAACRSCRTYAQILHTPRDAETITRQRSSMTALGERSYSTTNATELYALFLRSRDCCNGY